ncbi:MAG: hypothetical protein GWN67_06800 [Phycisphaerae bacterium]|nr:hypothetical protein [Phycisphaerae bacterium]NIW72606.1 hypothetical protein [candidate division KSB1 bacterium]NIP51676.1 hypothetical protein [Phycisphaerae bacterium]NIS50845.1 hypothetical protein [Phycisphaerae bacterium]NIU08564.1 hypothetical protein [Phycisphaerae bacterium]
MPIFAGGIIHWIIHRFHKRRATPVEQVEKSGRNGLLFASGLITGEALMGIVLAVPIVILKRYEVVLPYLEHVYKRTLPYGGLLGTIMLVAVGYWLYLTARGNATAEKVQTG